MDAATVDQILTMLAKFAALVISGVLVNLIKRASEVADMELSKKHEEEIDNFFTKKILEAEEGYISDPKFRATAERKAQELYGEVSSAKAKLAHVVAAGIDKFPNIDAKEAKEITDSLLPTLADAGIGGVAKKITEAMED